MKEVEPIHKLRVNKNTVEMLEELLVKARAGDLASIMFVDLYADGSFGHGWSGVPHIKMIGELESMKLRYLSQVTPLMETDS